ncbi:MAG TPA: hypothetical protein PKL17_01220 [Pseudomonadota bacterium]|jgi:hypothetical protein|nr:hypothetical protein [Pseudomonadota bacterium]HNK43371.1 hypothetical protein [Pseudomonadota bacterium]
MDHQAIESRLRGAPSDLSAWDRYSEHLTAQGDLRGRIIRLSQKRGFAPAGSERFAALSAELDRLYAEATPQISGLPRDAKIDWKYGFAVGLQLRLTTAAVSALHDFLQTRDAVLFRSLRFLPTKNGLPEEEDEEEWSGEGEDVNTPPEPTLLAEAKALAALDLRSLRVLAMPYCLIGAEGATRLLSSSQMGPLLSLDLRYSYVGDACAQTLAESPQCAGLRSLWLQRCAITAKGVQHLSKSPHLRELRLLDLRYNKIGSKGAVALANSPIVRELSQLHLYRDEIKKAGVLALAKSSQLPLVLRRMWGQP